MDNFGALLLQMGVWRGYSPRMSSTRPGLDLIEFRMDGYKAYAGPVELRLARMNLIIGRNNAGKSALCFAPICLPAVPAWPTPCR